jgi:heterodisulfide reductase subunit A
VKAGKEKRVLIIGAGIAGMTAALELAEAGLDVTLVERNAFIGGNALEYCCKADLQCNQCAACLVERTARETGSKKGISILTRAEIEGLSADNGSFRAQIRQNEEHVNSHLCTACGLCEEKCPAGGEEGKAIRRPRIFSPSFSYVLDTARCLYFRDGSCTACRDICPAGAIDFEAGPVRVELEAGAVILASGFRPFDARRKPQYGYGRFRNVITGSDLERALRLDDRLSRPSDGREPERIAFIQCVGSRDVRLQHEYCSQACCGYALKTASALRHNNPSLDVTIFYMDLQTAGKGWESFIGKCRRELRLVRGLPGEIVEVGDGNLRIDYEDLDTNELVHGVFDLVVLSIGMEPAAGSDLFSKLLKIETSGSGFFKSRSALENTLTSAGGVFLAGACENPKNIPDSIVHARKAALQAIAYLESR